MCPKDPNARTDFDIAEEIERLALVNKQGSLKLLDHVSNQISEPTPQKFIISKPIDINTSDEFSECVDSENADRFFTDVMAIKSDTLFDLDTVITNLDQSQNSYRYR